MDTLLLVEDDKMAQDMLRAYFEKEGYIIFPAHTGKRSMEILKQHKVSLVLLDLSLPDQSGLDTLEDIRKHTDIPVIIVSGQNSKDAKVRGLESGADDFVSKPYEIDILHARIKANIRRYKGLTSSLNVKIRHDLTQQIVKFGKWTLDRTRFQVFDPQNSPASLTAREYRLLDTLVCKAGHVLRREELCEQIRERNYVPTPRAIDVKITRIRKKLDDDAENPKLIKTVRGIGYMLEESEITH